jgi:hypothetical protein
VVHPAARHAHQEQAIELLQAVRAGDARSGELARTFALGVGEGLEPVNGLVAAVLAGGPFTIRRAMELAEVGLALSAAPAAAARCPAIKAGEGR